MERSWAAFGRSWGALGALLAALGASCGALEAHLGASWALLEASWAKYRKNLEGSPLFEAILGLKMKAKIIKTRIKKAMRFS